MEHDLENLRYSIDGIEISMGTIVGRVNNSKNQQGCFVRQNSDGALELINVIDINEGTLFASEGLLQPEKGDHVFYYKSTFKNSPCSKDAIEIVRQWALYKKNPNLHQAIERFVVTTFVPEQLLQWKKEDTLIKLFVPIQQKFRIGRFKERRNPDRICKDDFKWWLDSLNKGDHLTYVARILHQRGYKPKFFSAGTRPHQVTESILYEKTYSFKITHAGHIRMVGIKGGKKHFLVDVGSNYIGRGAKAPFHVAEDIVKSLEKVYPDYFYTPVAGRAAFGDGQSY